MKMSYLLVAMVMCASVLPQSASAQSRREAAIQACIQQAQAKWGMGFDRQRSREASYRACMHRYGFRP
jgi:hypothetical protein